MTPDERSVLETGGAAALMEFHDANLFEEGPDHFSEPGDTGQAGRWAKRSEFVETGDGQFISKTALGDMTAAQQAVLLEQGYDALDSVQQAAADQLEQGGYLTEDGSVLAVHYFMDEGDPHTLALYGIGDSERFREQATKLKETLKEVEPYRVDPDLGYALDPGQRMAATDRITNRPSVGLADNRPIDVVAAVFDGVSDETLRAAGIQLDENMAPLRDLHRAQGEVDHAQAEVSAREWGPTAPVPPPSQSGDPLAYLPDPAAYASYVTAKKEVSFSLSQAVATLKVAEGKLGIAQQAYREAAVAEIAQLNADRRTYVEDLLDQSPYGDQARDAVLRFLEDRSRGLHPDVARWAEEDPLIDEAVDFAWRLAIHQQEQLVAANPEKYPYTTIAFAERERFQRQVAMTTAELTPVLGTGIATTRAINDPTVLNVAFAVASGLADLTIVGKPVVAATKAGVSLLTRGAVAGGKAAWWYGSGKWAVEGLEAVAPAVRRSSPAESSPFRYGQGAQRRWTSYRPGGTPPQAPYIVRPGSPRPPIMPFRGGGAATVVRPGSAIAPTTVRPVSWSPHTRVSLARRPDVTSPGAPRTRPATSTNTPRARIGQETLAPPRPALPVIAASRALAQALAPEPAPFTDLATEQAAFDERMARTRLATWTDPALRAQEQAALNPELAALMDRPARLRLATRTATALSAQEIAAEQAALAERLTRAEQAVWTAPDVRAREQVALDHEQAAFAERMARADLAAWAAPGLRTQPQQRVALDPTRATLAEHMALAQQATAVSRATATTIQPWAATTVDPAAAPTPHPQPWATRPTLPEPTKPPKPPRKPRRRVPPGAAEEQRRMALQGLYPHQVTFVAGARRYFVNLAAGTHTSREADAPGHPSETFRVLSYGPGEPPPRVVDDGDLRVSHKGARPHQGQGVRGARQRRIRSR